VVMTNIRIALGEVHAQLNAAGRNPTRESLTLVQTREGGDYYIDGAGDVWRAYLWIDADVYNNVAENNADGRQLAYEAARVAGDFQRLVSGVDSSGLKEVIPGFHDTPLRYEQLEAALVNGMEERIEECSTDIGWALVQKEHIGRVMGLMETGDIPEAVVHQDTKVNNVMYDDGVGLALIDLDTVGPGSRLFDFGDLGRTTTGTFAEDETNLSKVVFHMELFESIVKEYMDSFRGSNILKPAEVENLAHSAWLITYEIGIRFLADYLTGETYFNPSYVGKTRNSARTQFALARQMATQMGRMEEIVRRHVA